MTAVAFSEDKDHPFRELVTSNDKSIGRNLLQRGYGRDCGCECGCDCDCEKTKKKRKRQRKKKPAGKEAYQYVRSMENWAVMSNSRKFDLNVGGCKAICLSIDCNFIVVTWTNPPPAESERADSVITWFCDFYKSGAGSLYEPVANEAILKRL